MYNFQNMTQEWQAQGKCQIHIGYTDLAEDFKGIKYLLRLPNARGVLLQTWHPAKGDVQIYRPTTNIATAEDRVPIMRKFLMIISALGGRVALTAIRDKKDEPKESYDFEGYYRALAARSKMFEV